MQVAEKRDGERDGGENTHFPQHPRQGPCFKGCDDVGILDGGTLRGRSDEEQQQQEEEEMVDGRPAVSADKYVASVFAEKERRIIGALGT